jgi:hypothetical protein
MNDFIQWSVFTSTENRIIINETFVRIMISLQNWFSFQLWLHSLKGRLTIELQRENKHLKIRIVHSIEKRILWNYLWNICSLHFRKLKRFFFKHLVELLSHVMYNTTDLLLLSRSANIFEVERKLVVWVKVLEAETVGSNLVWGDYFSSTIYLDQIISLILITRHVWMCCNPAIVRVDFVDG